MVPWVERGERGAGRKVNIRVLKALMWKARMKWVSKVRRTLGVHSFRFGGGGGAVC